MMKKIHQKDINMQRGAVSLFVVIFTAILLTTITVGFMQLMVRDHQQASNADLSESAYDSAIAGVEDAKRAMIELQKCEAAADTETECNNIRTAMGMRGSATCSSLGIALHPSSVGEGDEVVVKVGESDAQLNQAYTCVKVTSDTEDYRGSLNPNAGPVMVPLRAKGEFDRIQISWHQKRGGEAVDLIDLSGGGDPSPPLPMDYPGNRPSILRAQLIHGGNSFNLSDFDGRYDSESASTGYSNTLFLYPVSTGGVDSMGFALDTRRSSPGNENEPQAVNCNAAVSSGGFVCSVVLELPNEIDEGDTTAFLNLMAFYNTTDFKVQLFNGPVPDPISDADIIKFDGVQPKVDSTGRANDLFRRVESRIEMGNAFNYPAAALETTEDLCKVFSVTTDVKDYVGGSCGG